MMLRSNLLVKEQPFAKSLRVATCELFLVLAQNSCHDTPDSVIGEFEGTTYERWTTTGTAFGSGPASGTKPVQLEVQGTRGNGLASSELVGDMPVGTLTSPPFKIERRYISFVIGGGSYGYRTCANLLVSGKIVWSAIGSNSDHLLLASWDVSQFKGQMA